MSAKTFKPTKRTWKVFSFLLFLNIFIVPLLGIMIGVVDSALTERLDWLDSALTERLDWLYIHLMFLPIYQLTAPLILFEYMGVQAVANWGDGFGSLLPSPNSLGLLLMILSVLISLVIHYIIALASSKWIEKKEQRNNSGIG